MKTTSLRTAFLLIVCISVVTFTLAITRTGIDTSFFIGLLFDAAQEFARSGTIVSDFMPIGYSGFLGTCVKAGGVGAIPACQSFIYAGVLFAVFLFFYLRGAGNTLLIFGILAIALHPVFLLNIWRVHDGNATTFLLFGFLVAGIAFSRFGNKWSILFLGVFAGLLLTVRGNALFLVFPASVLLWTGMRHHVLDYLKRIAIFLAGAVLAFAAVNFGVKQTPFFFPEYGPYNFFSGANEYTATHLLESYGAENSLGDALNARGFSSVDTLEERLAFPPRAYKSFALEYIKEHPFHYAKLAGIKLVTLFRPGYHVPDDFTWNSADGVKRLLKILLATPVFIWVFILYKTRPVRGKPLQAAAAASSTKRTSNGIEKENLFIVLVVVFYLLPFLVANADPRYRFPVDIILIADIFSRAKKFFTLLRERKRAEKAPPVKAGMNEGILRSLGKGGYASEGSARRSVWRGTTGVSPWGSTRE